MLTCRPYAIKMFTVFEAAIWVQTIFSLFFSLDENRLSCLVREQVQRISGRLNVLLGHLSGGYWFLPSGAHWVWQSWCCSLYRKRLNSLILDLMSSLFIVLQVDQQCSYSPDSAGTVLVLLCFSVFAVFTSPALWGKILPPVRSKVSLNSNRILKTVVV